MTMASKKHKRDESVADSSSKTDQCIIHCRVTLSGPLTALTEERLSKLKEIQKLRLSEPVDSPHRMLYVSSQNQIQLSRTMDITDNVTNASHQI